MTILVAACQDAARTEPPVEQIPVELSFVDVPPTTGELGRPLDAPIHVQVLDEAGEGIAGVPVLWVINDGGQLLYVVDTTNSLGRARAVWVLGNRLGGEHVLRVVVAGLAPLELEVAADLGGSVHVDIDSTQWASPLDTIDAVVPGYVRARVTTAHGGPIKGLQVLLYPVGVPDPRIIAAVTDDSGRISMDWALGPVAGLTQGRLVAQLPDTLVVTPFFATVRPGRPKALAPTVRPQAFHSLTDTARVVYAAVDRNGNAVPYDSISVASLAPAIITVDSLGLITTVANGTGQVVVALRNGVDADTFSVNVQQVPASLSFIGTPPAAGELGRPLSAPIRIQLRDARAVGIAGAAVAWSIDDGGQLLPAGDSTDLAGEAQVQWVLGNLVDGDHHLVAQVAGLPPLALEVDGTLGGRMVVAIDTAAPTPADTIGATLPDFVTARFLTASGAPIQGLRVSMFVVDGWDPAMPSAITDSSGRVTFPWTLGEVAGSAEARLVAQTADTLAVTQFFADVLPGRPNFLFAPSHPSTMDALGATGSVTYGAYDRLGNPVSPDSLQLRNLSPGIVTVTPAGVVTSIANGVAYVVAELVNGQDADTFQVHVRQIPVALKIGTVRRRTNWLNDSIPFTVTLKDRLGQVVPDTVEQAGVLVDGSFDLRSVRFARAAATGTGRIIASTPLLADTVTLTAQQIPAVLTVAKASDTLKLDSTRTLITAFKDSGGTDIPRSFIHATGTDPSVATVDFNGTHALFPGSTTLTYEAGDLSVSVKLQVEGVALTLNGARRLATGDVTGISGLQLTNGRIRLSWDYRLIERGGLFMETNVNGQWLPANSQQAGDWLFVTSTVVTEPTQINVIKMTDSLIGVSMQYADHHFRPQFHGFPPSYTDTPYPFTRSFWLKRSQFGYWTWVDVGPAMPWVGVEHEVGFGAVYGPARVKTFEEDFRTDTMPSTYFYNLDQSQDGVEIRRDSDPVRRFLFALPGHRYVTPVFPGLGFGGAYLHSSDYADYGAYVYAAPYSIGENGRALCRRAWKQAPFPLPAITEPQLALCGPS